MEFNDGLRFQGYCGDCWAFSATEQIESDLMRTAATTLILSPQQINQCDLTSYGCGGGWTSDAYDYVTTAGGLSSNALYPYSTTTYDGTTGTCTTNTADYVATVSGYTYVSGEATMAAYVQSTGPLSVCIDATLWNSYVGGIMTVCGSSVDHCVQAVGVYPVTGGTGYWKVRNSWDATWGESGFIRLVYGANTCAITTEATYATVSLVAR